MLISHHPASAEYLQLGEGMLLCGFDLDKALSSRDPPDTEMTERVTTLTPKQARKALSRLCWIGTTSRGLLVIELRNPLCVSGASLTSVPDGAGRLPFTFLAQNDRPGDVNLPARLYWWKEETHDAA